MINHGYLVHHGILGQKWGVRRYQNPDGTYTELGKERYSDNTDYKSHGGTLKKNTIVGRMTNNYEDRTYDNKKYVSHLPEDHEEWKKYFEDEYDKTYSVMYQLIDDVKVADNTKAGEIFVKDILNKIGSEKVIQTSKTARWQLHNYDPEYLFKDFESYEEMGSYNLAMQTSVGKAYVEALKNRGYQAVADVHGQNVAKDPLIIFDPEKHLKRIN